MVYFSEKRMPNLTSYKYYIRPMANNRFGNDKNSKHAKNIQNILKILALEGPMTTWEMAKSEFVKEPSKIRSKEKEFRRLFVGRIDRGKFSEGILDLNLVLVDEISTKRNPGKRYRLSIYGILFCLDILDLKKREIDKIASNYSKLLPLTFGRWNFLKSIIGDNVYNISLLGKGFLFDNPNIVKINDSEFYELISFFGIKSNNISGSLNEQKIGELVSLWFFLTLLYFPKLVEKKNIQLLKKITRKDKEIHDRIKKFILEAESFYKLRTKVMKDISVI